MKVNVVLFGTMRRYAERDKFELELKEGATLGDLLDRLRIEDRVYIIVLVNGMRADEATPLSDGAAVHILTPVGGG
ncbi:MAG: MoaD/ThiS family protein [Firmicutes bacterium]|jgi:molybdopterin converting factor small subunit|nr:MoaD/ThiS family protein [Bacillota bacterium]MDH7496041.1 MoaD/ThiS family protein [Bacillota bacterium]